MTTETRRITFSHSELIQAISKRRRDEKQPLPESRIRGIRAESGAPPKVALLLDDAEGSGGRIVLRPEEVAAALIKFCGARDIPLPKMAKKTLDVDRGYVCLVLNLGNI